MLNSIIIIIRFFCLCDCTQKNNSNILLRLPLRLLQMRVKSVKEQLGI